MTRRLLRLAAVALLPLPAAAADKVPAFNAHVRPLLQAYCTECHGEAEKPKGKLDLRLRRLAVAGGESGPAVVPGKPDESLLLTRVLSGEMPPGKKKLTPEQADVLRRWIAGGAPVEKPEPDALAPGLAITDDDRHWWAFTPITRPPVPDAKPAERARTPIDKLLLVKLRDAKLGFAPDADKAAQLRRLSFDLTGLPPTPEEVATFEKDTSPDAYEKQVDRLLASPQYGERWARHWLDVAGYADSEGGSPADPVRTNAWKYRDYLIRSFNADKPFDRMIREQLAGDELVRRPLTNPTPDEVDLLVATGFLRTAEDGSATADAANQKAARNAVLTDTVKIVSSAFLGLTVGCAQCHNHRYDPIPQADFYRLRAVFEPAYDLATWKPPAARQISLLTPIDKKKAADLEAEAVKIDKERLALTAAAQAKASERELAKVPVADRGPLQAALKVLEAKRTAAQKALIAKYPSANVAGGLLRQYDPKAFAEVEKLTKQAADLREKKPKDDQVRGLTELPGPVPTTFLHHRGDPDQPKEAVAPGGLAVLDGLPLRAPEKPTAAGTTGRRLALAYWLTDPKQPLTARVLVNRVWMHHFGRGLVASPGDFGRLGTPPTHPELLDYLASEFVANGWSLKKLHRTILTSTAYRQASKRDPAKDAVDPDNKLLGRYPLRRLDAEAVRDAMLAVSGKLNPKAFGPPVPVRENEVGQFVLGNENRDGAGRFVAGVPLAAGEEFRRSVYVQVRRTKPLAVLDTFDRATTDPNCEFRTVSTATPQALMLLNGEFATATSEALADRVKTDAGTDVAGQVARAWALAYGRPPTAEQAKAGAAFVAAQAKAFAKAEKPATPEGRALAVFCQALLGSNRFLYLD